jgi:hypothetical protein
MTGVFTGQNSPLQVVNLRDGLTTCVKNLNEHRARLIATSTEVHSPFYKWNCEH